MKIIKISTCVKEPVGFSVSFSREDLKGGPDCKAINVIKALQHELEKNPSVETTEDDISDLFSSDNNVWWRVDMDCLSNKKPTVVAQIVDVNNNKLWAVKVLKECCECSLKEAKDCADANPKTITFRAPKDAVLEYAALTQRNGYPVSIRIISEDPYEQQNETSK